MSWLTAIERVSGDALLFLAGTIIGYIIVIIQELVLASSPERRPIQKE